MNDDVLISYIQKQRLSKVPDEAIKIVLRSAGWSDDQLADAFEVAAKIPSATNSDSIHQVLSVTQCPASRFVLWFCGVFVFMLLVGGTFFAYSQVPLRALENIGQVMLSVGNVAYNIEFQSQGKGCVDGITFSDRGECNSPKDSTHTVSIQGTATPNKIGYIDHSGELVLHNVIVSDVSAPVSTQARIAFIVKDKALYIKLEDVHLNESSLLDSFSIANQWVLLFDQSETFSGGSSSVKSNHDMNLVTSLMPILKENVVYESFFLPWNDNTVYTYSFVLDEEQQRSLLNSFISSTLSDPAMIASIKNAITISGVVSGELRIDRKTGVPVYLAMTSDGSFTYGGYNLTQPSFMFSLQPTTTILNIDRPNVSVGNGESL